MFDEVHLDDLDDGIGQVHGIICAGRRQLLAMIAAVDRREGWRSMGQPTDATGAATSASGATPPPG